MSRTVLPATLEELAGAYHRFYGACRIPSARRRRRHRRAPRASGSLRRHPTGPGQRSRTARRHRTGANVNAHPAGPKHAEQLQAPGLPDRPTSPRSLRRNSHRRCGPRNASRGDDGEVTLAGVKVGELAEKYGTPLFVIDEDDFRSRCRDMARALRPGCQGALRIQGIPLWRDRTLGSPTKASRSTSAPAANWRSRCTRTSRPSELPCTATTSQSPNWPLVSAAGVGHVVLDSSIEIDRLDRVAGEAGVVQDVLIRLTVGVEAHTHEFISTAHEDPEVRFLAGRGERRSTQSVASSLPTTCDWSGLPQPHRFADLRRRRFRGGSAPRDRFAPRRRHRVRSREDQADFDHRPRRRHGDLVYPLRRPAARRRTGSKARPHRAQRVRTGRIAGADACRRTRPRPSPDLAR